MSASLNQQRLVEGYCRTNAWDNITLVIIQIIIKYFVISDCWAGSYDDESLFVDEDDTFVEWPYSVSQIHDCTNAHRSLFGNFMFETGYYPHTVKLRWELEFSVMAQDAHPFFIGISNDNSHKLYAPFDTFDLEMIKTTATKKMYTGFAFCFYNRTVDDPWIESYSHYVTPDNEINQDDPKTYEAQGIVVDNDHFWGVDFDRLIFGEIEFTVILDGHDVGTLIKIFIHPETLSNHHPTLTDWKWSKCFKHNNHSKDLCSLSTSISCGSSIKLNTFEILGNVKCDFRKRRESMPIFSLYQ